MTRWFVRSAGLAIFYISLLVPAAFCVDNWPVPRGPSREPRPYRYQAKHVEMAPSAFLDNAPAVMVYYGITYLVEDDGTVETIIHEVTRLNGRKGVESLGEYRGITYDPAYQTFKLNEARVIKADGSKVPVQPQHVHVRDTNVDGLVYDHEKEVHVSFPNLEVGDAYEVKWTTRGKSPEFEGHFFTRHRFGTINYPLIREEVRIHLPTGKELKYAALNGDVDVLMRERSKRRFYTFTAKNLPPLPRDNDLPSREELRLQLMCSTFPSWEAVGKWKQRLRQHCWECTQDIRKTVQEITGKLKTPEEKARALTYWVRKQIRYVSVVSARHRYTPHQPAKVLSDLSGDCKDQAQLLAVMLREIGLPVYLVSLGVLGDGQVVEEVPSPWSTHGILLVKIGDKEHWIDTTSSMAGWNFLPRTDRDRVAYVTDEQGKLHLRKTPKLSAAENRFEQTTIVQVLADGTTDCRRINYYHGQAALIQREEWLGTPPGERRRLMTVTLQDSHNRSKLVQLDLDENDLKSFDDPVRASLHFQILHHFNDADIREASFTDSHVWSRLLAYNLDHDRKFAMDLWAPFESVHRYVIELPALYRFKTRSWKYRTESKWGSFAMEIKREADNPRRMEVLYHTKLNDSRVTPADFEAYRKYHQEIYKNWRAWAAMVVTQEMADVPLLKASLEKTPSDLLTAKTLARIFQTNGYHGEAREVLEKALKIAPSDRELWDLAIKATSTLEQEELIYRRMIRQFPKAQEDVVALAATCILRGKHSEAEQLLKPLTENSSEEVQARSWYQLSRSAQLRKKPKQALEYFQKAKLAKNEVVETVPATYFEGQLLEELGQREAAIKAYRWVVQRQGDFIDALAGLVRLELQAGRHRQALDWLRKYTMEVKGNLQGLEQAAEFHLQMGRLEDAFDLAMRARDLDFHANTQRLLGLVYYRRGQYEKALFHLERANHQNDELYHMILAYLALGQWHKAVGCVEEARRLSAPSANLRALMIQFEHLQNRQSALLKTVKVKQELRQWCGPAVDCFVCAEWAFVQGKPPEQVRELLDRAGAKGVEIGAMYSLRALLSLEKGFLRSAGVDVDRALALDPGEARAYYVRGRIKFERREAGAVEDLRKAVQLTGGQDPLVLHWLAAALFENGHPVEALNTHWLARIIGPAKGVVVHRSSRAEAGIYQVDRGQRK